MEMPPGANRPPQPAPDTLMVLLLVLAVLLPLGGVALGVVALALVTEAREAGLLQALVAVGFIVGGCAGACVLWAMAWVLRHLHEMRLRREVNDLHAAEMLPEEAGPPTALLPPVVLVDAQPEEAPTLERVLAELKEIRTNTLLSGEQREAKRLQHQTRRMEEIVSRVSKAVGEREFQAADAWADQLNEEVPGEPRYVELKREIADARSAHEAADLAAATRRAGDLMAVASFVEAQQAAQELLGRYPSSAEAAALAERVRREGTNFTREHRRRLYAEIELYVQNRRWRQAVAAAGRFLGAHPACPEADLVRTQMPTLEDNACIEEVRDMRDRILDYIDRRRYLEAIELSRDVVARFPQTAAAEELREQIPRWLELARGGAGGRL